MGLVRASLCNLEAALLLRRSSTRGTGGVALSISNACIGVVRNAAQMWRRQAFCTRVSLLACFFLPSHQTGLAYVITLRTHAP